MRKRVWIASAVISLLGLAGISFLIAAIDFVAGSLTGTAAFFESYLDYLLENGICFLAAWLFIVMFICIFTARTFSAPSRMLKGLEDAGEAKTRYKELKAVAAKINEYDSALAASRTALDIKQQELKDKQSEENMILDSIQHGLIIFENKDTPLIINKKAAEITGYQEGQKLTYFQDDQQFADIFKLNENVTVLKTIDRRDYEFAFEFSPRMLVFITDVTIKRNLERIKDEFVHGVTSEMSGPLSSITTSAELIKGGLRIENMRKAAMNISRESKKMSGLLKSIQTYAQMDAMNMPVYEVDVAKIAEEQIGSLRGYMKEKRVAVSSSLQSVIIQSRREDVALLVYHLVTNAIKFNKKGGSVEVTLTDKPETLVVRDTGIGINEYNLEKVFERFYKEDADSGYGMGLAIVRKIAEKNGWAITLESEKGQGSIVTVTFV